MNIQQIPHSLPIFPRLQSDSYRSTSNVNHNPVNSASDLRAKSVSFGDAPNGDEPLSGFEPLDEHAPSNATVITHNQSAHSDRYSELNLPRPSVMQPQKTAYDDDEDYNEDLPIMNLLNSEQPRGSAVPIDPDADGKYDEGFDGDGDSHSDLAVGGGDGDNALFTGNNNRADGRYETNGNGVIQHQDSDQEDDRLRPMGPMSMGTNDISTNQQHHVFSPDVFSPDGSPPGGRTGSGTGIGGKGTVAKYGRMSSQMEGDDEEEDNGLLATNLDIHPTPGHQPVMAFSTVIPRQSLKDRPSGPLLEDQGVNGPLPLMEHTSSAEQAQFENFAMRDIIRLKEKRSRRMKDNVSVSQSLSVNEVGNRISKKMPDSASPALVFVDSKIVDQKENENDSDIDSDDDDDDEEEDGQLMVSHIGIAGDDEPVRFQIPGISQFDNDGDAQLIYDDEEEVEHESDNDVITGDVTAGNQAGQYME